MKKQLYKCLLYGSAWGISEATVGYVLHRFTLGIGWLLWFPIAYFFISRCYQATKNPYAVMVSALTASSLKFIDLFFPVRIDMVFNPAASIIIEALSAVLIITYLSKRGAESFPSEKPAYYILEISAISTLWRIFYLVYVLFLPYDLVKISPIGGIGSLLKFLIVENAANVLVITLVRTISRTIKLPYPKHLAAQAFESINRNRLLKPAISIALIAAAIIIQIITV